MELRCELRDVTELLVLMVVPVRRLLTQWKVAEQNLPQRVSEADAVVNVKSTFSQLLSVLSVDITKPFLFLYLPTCSS